MKKKPFEFTPFEKSHFKLSYANHNLCYFFCTYTHLNFKFKKIK